ncbi:hypothetical protein LEP1GSC073_0558 [Leptospira noguchii str. Cascata]|nr:hypothetical protein LEP1GSC073_0558 [Leptospira noguchii str. Cascata]
MNEAGLSNDRIKGSEVKQKIDDASQSLIVILAAYDKSILTASNFLLNMSASKVAGIDSNLGIFDSVSWLYGAYRM